MPYNIVRYPEGYFVVSSETGKAHSKKPISLNKAKAQLRILNRKLLGGIIGEIPDSKLLAYKSQKAITQRAKEVLNILAFRNIPEYLESVITVQGSFNFPIYPYYSDIDSINRVNIKDNYKNSVIIFYNHIVKVAKYLKTNNRGFLFSDLKAGLYKDTGKGIHWTNDDILRGEKEGYKLINCIQDDGYCKIDVIVPYYGRYIEVSLIWSVNSLDGIVGQIPLTLEDFKIQIRKSYYELIDEGNYYKAIKRLYSLSRLNKDIPTIRKIEPLLVSNLGKLSTIKSDLATIKLIIENGYYPTLNYINIEFNKIKEGVSTILDVPINYKAIYITIDNLYELLRNHKIPEVIEEIDRLIDLIGKQLSKETKRYLIKHNLNFKP